MRERPEAGLRSVLPILNAKDVSPGVFARTVDATATPSTCAQCHVALERDELIRRLLGLQAAADRRLAALTQRQYEIMEMVLAGHPSKNIAADLHISQRTVENHRQSIMKRTGVRSLPELARLALAAEWNRPIGAAAERGVSG
jgi:DNA-binding NarL/FixJ family response regulator